MPAKLPAGRYTFLDVYIFSRFNEEHSKEHIFQALHSAERKKIREYQERIETVENADFVPFVITESGLFGRQARKFLFELSDRLSVKLGQSLAVVRSCMMAELSFIIQRRLLACYFAPRGSRPVLPLGSFLSLSAPYVAYLAGLDRNS